MGYWAFKNFAVMFAYLCVAAVVCGLVEAAGVLVLVVVVPLAAAWLAREWRRAAPPPQRRSGMKGSRLPETDDYEPGTLTLRRR